MNTISTTQSNIDLYTQKNEKIVEENYEYFIGFNYIQCSDK